MKKIGILGTVDNSIFRFPNKKTKLDEIDQEMVCSLANLDEVFKENFE